MIGNGTVLCGPWKRVLAAESWRLVAPSLISALRFIEPFGPATRPCQEAAEKLTPLARAVTKTYGIGGLKTAMNLAGFSGGPLAPPLRLPSAIAQSEIASCLLRPIQ